MVELRLLGFFDLVIDGRSEPVPVAVQRLLAFVALHAGAVSRPYVAGTLWPDVSDQRAAANLRSAVWRTPAPDRGLLRSSPSHLRLDGSVIVDSRVAVDRARVALRTDGDLGDLERLDSDLLPGWTDEWVVVERERIRQLRLHALEANCRHLVDQGATARAIDVGLTAVAAEPLRESAQRCLIIAHLAEGNTAEAIRVYEGFRDRLRGALSISPSGLMDDLLAPALQSH